MSEEAFPQIAFLGFAERATSVREGETNLVKWNVLPALKIAAAVNPFRVFRIYAGMPPFRHGRCYLSPAAIPPVVTLLR